MMRKPTRGQAAWLVKKLPVEAAGSLVANGAHSLPELRLSMG